jgi:hypothetical protein
MNGLEKLQGTDIEEKHVGTDWGVVYKSLFDAYVCGPVHEFEGNIYNFAKGDTPEEAIENALNKLSDS